MKINQCLAQCTRQLKDEYISTARLDCLVLLGDLLDKSRAWILANPDHELTATQQKKLATQIKRRAAHEPLAYIRGKSEFYGREFFVNAHTLEPRPETETMIDLLKQIVDSSQTQRTNDKRLETRDKRQETGDNDLTIVERLHGSDDLQGGDEQRTEMYKQYIDGVAESTTPQGAERTGSASSLAAGQFSSPLTIVDVGTGSGCIGITAKLLYPQSKVIAIDIDKKCVTTARKNAKKHGTEIDFLYGNLLEPLIGQSAGFTYAEAEADFSLSSEVKRISNTVHEPRKVKSGSGPQASNRVASSADKQVIGGMWILLANLPYVPDAYTINQAAMHEPQHAIFGGQDGLDYYRELFEHIATLAIKPAFIFTESLPFQHQELRAIAQKYAYDEHNSQDFIQVLQHR